MRDAAPGALDSLRLDGRAALVTGGGRGMGRTHCEVLAERGARVLVADVDGDVADETARRIVEAGGDAVAEAADISIREHAEGLVDRAAERFGALDILVHNAGLMYSGTGLAETDDESWRALFGVNVDGPLYLTRAALPLLRRSAAGRVIFVSSQWGQVGPGHSYAYITSKAAMIGFAKNLALELAAENVLVNVITPGAVRTRMVPDETIEAERALIPVGRIADPRELSYMVAFLASDEASFITGQTIPVNGGALVVGI
jgi:NAD(P)-dependent dehydrogenase (short-subunit alcohol dehydrogenase family)